MCQHTTWQVSDVPATVPPLLLLPFALWQEGANQACSRQCSGIAAATAAAAASCIMTAMVNTMPSCCYICMPEDLQDWLYRTATLEAGLWPGMGKSILPLDLDACHSDTASMQPAPLLPLAVCLQSLMLRTCAHCPRSLLSE